MIFLLIGIAITLWASYNIKATFKKYSLLRYSKNATAEVVANWILKQNGITNVRVERISGSLTDHYDPVNKVLRLSDSVYGSVSMAAIGVAAHECGHAIQDAEGYMPLRFRGALVPAANLGSRLGIPIIILGVILGSNYLLVQIGIWVFSLAVLFQLITLPVEFNASNRAMNILENRGILGQEELEMSQKVLSAAALTYVAAAASSVLQLLRLVLLFGGGRRRDD